MTVKFLDLSGLSYFKGKLDTAHTAAIQSAVQSALQQFSQDVFTVVSTLPVSNQKEGIGYMVPNPDDSTLFDVYVWEITDDTTNPVTYGWVKASGAHVAITIDSALDATSENPLQNKVIKAALDTKLNVTDTITTNDIDALFL